MFIRQAPHYNHLLLYCISIWNPHDYKNYFLFLQIHLHPELMPLDQVIKVKSTQLYS